ncbi:HIP-like protein [Mya arenaria]|uniref:HIP-like protein n=1 Tax=Mya arenaria TaxID=6604 RepID=A0ABY7DC59_MYAAR|nr:complement C1q-like protein 4 [Mya arenaria]WAQ93955.1 HIP-like protein [Mya arenaria]
MASNLIFLSVLLLSLEGGFGSECAAMSECCGQGHNYVELFKLYLKSVNGYDEPLFDRVTALERLMTELQSDLDALRPANVLFKAKTLNDRSLATDQILVFNDVMYNYGNGYDSKTGKFTCPRNGTYLFTTSICINGGEALYFVFDIMVDHQTVTRSTFAEHVSMGSNCHTGEAIVNLVENQEVYLKYTYTSWSTDGIREEALYRWNTFSGTILHP